MMAFQGAIFDVDGVLVDSPHELAWRESFRSLMEGEWRQIRDQTTWAPERFTPEVYQQVMAGMPRMAGARAAMEYFGVPDIDARIEQYAAAKQEHVVGLIEKGLCRATTRTLALSWRFLGSLRCPRVLADQAVNDLSALDPGGHIDRLARARAAEVFAPAIDGADACCSLRLSPKLTTRQA